MSGNEFADRTLDQILHQGADIEIETVVSIRDEGDKKVVCTEEGGEYEGKTVVIATGVKHRMLGLEGEDALSNLTHDAAMTNVIALDGRYTLHHRRLALAQPGVVFAATDGVFGYIRTPMEFEWLLLRVLRDAEDPTAFLQRLEQILDELAGDDFTLALMSFGFGDFRTLRDTLTPRIPALERDYVKPLHHGRTDALQAELWAQYRTGYERFLTTKGGGA